MIKAEIKVNIISNLKVDFFKRPNGKDFKTKHYYSIKTFLIVFMFEIFKVFYFVKFLKMDVENYFISFFNDLYFFQTPHHSNQSGFPDSRSSSNNNSPYMSKLIGKIKKKVIPSSSSNSDAKIIEIRPKTTKLERPTIASLDLPQINVQPQVVISKSLSRYSK